MPGQAVHRLTQAGLGCLLSWMLYRAVELAAPPKLSGRIWLTGVACPLFAFLFSAGCPLVRGDVGLNGALLCGNAADCNWLAIRTEVANDTVDWLFIFAGWGLVLLLLRTVFEIRAADARTHFERQSAKEAQIRALRYQINPHFLFNCLNSLTALVKRDDPAHAEEMIGELGRFIRFNLMVDTVEDVSIDSEVELQRRYLDLEQRRFAARMSVTVDIAPEAARAAVPPLILQPLVENAVKHGVGAVSGPVRIGIEATASSDDMVSVIVSNVGEEPVAATVQSAEGLGIGLNNVAARLKARFGEAATLEAASTGRHAFKVELRFPLVLAKD